MIPVPRTLFAIALAATAGGLSAAQQRIPTSESEISAPPYAEYADLVLASPVIVDARIRSTSRLKASDAMGVAPGHVRLYVEADVLALIRSTTPLAPRIGYVLDVTPDARGRLPKLDKARVLLFARTVPNNATLIQLVRPDAQRSWAPGADALTRRITRETLATDAPPTVTGVGNAFHTAGALPGEGETQIFLTTADNRPVSLTIDRRPGEPQHWAVSLSEIVDKSAGPPQRDTLLWYRLACALPSALPDSSVASATPEDAGIARDDYQFVVKSLGPCDRGSVL
jgi:hypothetical protein